MSAIALFVVLLLLAYVGSILVGGRAIRGYGLPSGSEYLVLGFVLGPNVLGVLERSTMQVFHPVAHVGLGWLSLLIGLDYAVMGERRVRARSILASLGFATFTWLAVAATTYVLGRHLTELAGADLVILAGGVGAVACETTRHAVRWVVERYGAVGPLSEVVASIADADDLAPLLVVAALFALRPVATAELMVGSWIWFSGTVLLGVVLGLACSALLGEHLHSGEAFTFVLGAALLATGAATQLGLSSLTTLFALGLTVSLGSKHRTELRAMLEVTERPVLLPVLLLAGATLELRLTPTALVLLGAAIGVRILGKQLTGWALGRPLAPAQRSSGLLGLGLLPSGVLTISIGYAFALRFPNVVGPLVLMVAVGVTLFGELTGPIALRRALYRAGELTRGTASRTLMGF